MSASVEDTAIRWAVRIDAQDLSDHEQRALDGWLRQDSRHRGALFRARAGLALVDGLGAEPLAEPHPAVRRWVRASAAIAAGFAGLLALSLSWSLWSGQQYSTDLGEIRRVPLADGSVVLVNTDSDLEVHYGNKARQLRLDAGEAWFKVAKDRRKPFIVEADGVHVQATGTAFSVRRREQAVEIVVTEGTVRAWRDDQPGRAIAVSAGNTATISTAADRPAASVAPIGNGDPLAWRQGGVALNETTVFDAAAEFNRYNPVKIDVASPQVGSQRMTGYFQIDRPDEFSQAVADVTGASVSKDGNKYIIKM
ncbi:FecR family protein [Novosphingobium album (ex Liu et al. 2023)]|uniref:FecR domain-containing protein n=1 Tax=Novosphingobium album (ex Liu et al. 2023) TaxID=3031130 RepID=A0ABT5WJU4_9SPHN|nr:FecR domain-containing protein [Novosphingobium album (ex Liu et al. 2023)]MDE8650189.1 FecR domain-containing protein [Novosphingobium album (ex Liu et al. 2023)]